MANAMVMMKVCMSFLLISCLIYIWLTVGHSETIAPHVVDQYQEVLSPTTFPPTIQRKLLTFDSTVVVYNRVQKCGSRSVLQAVRPTLARVLKIDSL